MAEIVNLRRMRKMNERDNAQKVAAANRAKYGTPKAQRDASKAEKSRKERIVDPHKIEKE
ncbi:MAG TPA: DUF4169 family protein [Rhizomicrobium sp.]|jgi:hypothetical protein